MAIRRKGFDVALIVVHRCPPSPPPTVLFKRIEYMGRTLNLFSQEDLRSRERFLDSCIARRVHFPFPPGSEGICALTGTGINVWWFFFTRLDMRNHYVEVHHKQRLFACKLCSYKAQVNLATHTPEKGLSSRVIYSSLTCLAEQSGKRLHLCRRY